MLPFVGRAYGGNHLSGSKQLCHLDGIVSDRSSAARNKDNLALRRTINGNRAMSRQGWDPETGSRLERDPVGQSDRLLGRDCNVGCGCPKGPLPLAVPDPNPFPNPSRVDPGTHAVDDACPVAMRDYLRRNHWA